MSDIKTHLDFSKTFRILIASDIHLGYNEKHHERGNDSFEAFEEVLSLAKEEDVDLILLGGDLFHMNKPSFTTLDKTFELLRKYCLGCRPIQFRIVSNQNDNFSHYKNFRYANYLDDNLNVSMPLFTIHGNHDDPTGPNHTSVLDSLSSAGYINYFGKYTNIEEILLSPILLQKSDCKIALYGLGSLNEERLYRIITDGKLNYSTPESREDEWFKIVVVHQNRIKHSNTKYLREEFLTSLPDLVVWGHEHESRPELDYNVSQQFFIYQPGSTVATSLCEAEALPKHCGILEVFFDEIERKPKFKITSKPLKTVRNFVWDSVDIPDLIRRKNVESDVESIKEFCRERVETMIQNAKLAHSGDRRQPKIPLIRLRLEFNDESQQFHSAQFGAQFSGRVANHTDVIHYVKRREDHSYKDVGNIDLSQMRTLLDQEVIDERVDITNIIKEYFDRIDDQKLKLGILSENALTLAVKEMVDKESNEAISDVFEAQKQKMKNCLLDLEDLKIEDIRDEIKRIKSENVVEDESQDLVRILAESRKKVRTTVKTEPNNGDKNDSDFETNQMDVSDDEQQRPSASGRGRGGGKGRARGRGSAGKRSPETKPRVATMSSFNLTQESTSGRRHSPRRPSKRAKYYDEIVISDSD